MQTTTTSSPYPGFRFPQEIMSYAVWLYYRFSLRYRDVEELLAERGIIVSYETIRQWSQKFGQTYATQHRWRRARPGDTWVRGEVFLKINGKPHYLWRRSIRTATSSIFWCRAGGTQPQPGSSSASCSKTASMCRES